jgi:hypothetical protein
MAIQTSDVIDILHANGIFPDEVPEAVDLPATNEMDFPEVGEIEEGETVYSTSIGEVFREDGEEEGQAGIFSVNDPRIREWWQKVSIKGSDNLNSSRQLPLLAGLCRHGISGERPFVAVIRRS